MLSTLMIAAAIDHVLQIGQFSLLLLLLRTIMLYSLDPVIISANARDAAITEADGFGMDGP